MAQSKKAIRPSGPRSRLEQLPLEAKQAILFSLADIASLKATALTCSSLYDAFKNAEELITAQVLQKEIDVDVLPEAIIAHKSETWTKPPLFAAEHLQSRQPLSPKKRWKVSELLPLGEAARYINYFAADCAKRTLSVRPPQSTLPSRDEINRIKRALYRFEIYRNIFTTLTSPDTHFQARGYGAPADIFFRCFSPWENEQLACVYDYLFSIIAPMYNDIVEHDVAWGEYGVQYAKGGGSGYIQNILSFGLAKLYDIAAADSYESRRELIYSKHPYERQFLYQEMSYRRIIRPFTGHISHSFTIKSFFEDPDTGPTDAWSWAHQDENQTSNFVNSNSRRWLREWGYVFSDREMLNKMVLGQRGIMDVAWRRSRLIFKEKFASLGDARVRMDLRASWERRQRIFMAGGRGWWSEHDESRVQWTKGWCPWDDQEMRKSCPYCIGEVRCAPHRLVLRVKGRRGLIWPMDTE